MLALRPYQEIGVRNIQAGISACRDRFTDELVIDNFAGGGGASLGIERALGRCVDVAINHSAAAIAMHRRNHPKTKHYCEDIWAVDPVEVAGGRPVGLAWFSPDCTHFSRAKGGKPRKKKIRGLAWVVIRWAKRVRPRVIILENVAEFQTWGPLTEEDRPCPKRKGQTFKSWVGQLKRYGYRVEWRELSAADYGAPTTRKRLFLVARCDGRPIVWPEPTHGPGRLPYRTAAECIDWSLPCPSIFERERPLAENTMKRIAKGLQRYVLECPEPFILAKHYGGVVGQDLGKPIGTVTGVDHHSLCTAFLSKFYGTNVGSHPEAPMPTVTGGGNHVAEVRVFLIKYYSQGSVCQSCAEPMHTLTGKARMGLVVIEGQEYQIADIGLRMLQPRELARAQGFPDEYELTGTKAQQVQHIGNSVCPVMAEVLVKANYVGTAVAPVGVSA